MRTLKEILSMERFLVSGKADDEQSQKFYDWLTSSVKKGESTLSVIINSFGGPSSIARSLYGPIRQLQREGLTIVSLVSGTAYSSSALIALAANERYMTEESVIMFHRGKIELELKLTGNENLDQDFKEGGLKIENFKETDLWYFRTLATRTGHARSEIAEKEGKYLRSKEAREFGLVHHIL